MLRKLPVFILIYVISILLCAPFVEAKNSTYLNIDRSLRIGLATMGNPRVFKIFSLSGFIEIFDKAKNSAIYSGKGSEIRVIAEKKGKLKIIIDSKKNFYYFKDEVIFSPLGRAPNHLKLATINSKSKAYRGSISIRPEGSRLFAINIVDIEDYLKSVVPCEIFNRAPVSALEAQAIAARTYAVRNIERHVKKGFHLCDKVHCQAYKGMVKEISKASKAVMNTQGQVLTYDGSPANTVYHSNCGGILKSSSCAWGGKPVPYLVSHVDGIKGEELFCKIGKLVKKNKTPKKLQKARKMIVVRSLPLNTKKKFFSNFGHRVGMCQDGVIGMGTIGYSSRQILGFYYPGTRLVTLRYAVPKKPERKVKQVRQVIASRKPIESFKDNGLKYPPVVQTMINPTQLKALEDSRSRRKKNSIRSVLNDISSKLGLRKNVPANTKPVKFKKLFWSPCHPEYCKRLEIPNSSKASGVQYD